MAVSWGAFALVVLLAATAVEARTLTDRRALTQSGSSAVFIDEINWDNEALDFGEAIEIFGPVGLNIGGYVISRYAGGASTAGQACAISDCSATSYQFTIPANTILSDPANTGTGAGTAVIVFPANGLSNGGAEIALSDNNGQLLDYLAYSSASATSIPTASAQLGPAKGATPDPIPTRESGNGPVGVSVQRAGATTWSTTIGTNTFGAAYQNYFTTANAAAGGVPSCRLNNDGSISYGASPPGSTCTGTQLTSAYASPVSQPPLYSAGPLVIGAGQLPDMTTTLGLIADQNYRGSAASTTAPTPTPSSTTTSSPTPTATTTSTPTPTSTTTSTPTPTSTTTSSPTPTATTTSSPTPTATAGCSSAGETPIYTINGNGAAPTMVGSTVVVRGVLTGAFDGTNGLSGFYIQTPDAQADADPTTSNGIFVYFGTMRSNFVATAVGDIVQVAGTVANFNGDPEITTITALNICSRNNPPPAVASATLPAVSSTSPQGLRQYLGMLVNFPQSFTVTDNYNDDYYGEIKLSVNGRRYIPTQLVSPGTNAINFEAQNNARTILLDDGSSATGKTTPLNPIPYPYPGLSDSNTIRTGYTLTSPLTGDLTFGNSFGYEVEPTGGVSSVAFSSAGNPRPTTPPLVGGRIKVVGMNLENFFTQLQSSTCSSSLCRGASTQAQFNTQISKEVLAISALNADIYAFQELQNNGFNTGSAIATLTSAVNNKVGAGTYAYIVVNQPDGGSPSAISTDPNCNVQCVGGDAITVGIMYRVSAVTPYGVARALTKNIDPAFNSDIMRPSVAQTFVDNAGGKFTVVANHLKSKGSACTAQNDPDTGDGQGNCNLTRQKAAQALVRWLATDPTGSADPDFVLLGDMNAYAMEDPIKAFEAGGYINLLKTFIGDTAYSYVFGGESGYLDHAIASPSLVSQVTGIGEFHINADEPIALHYDHPSGLANPNSFYRCSDHDPLIMGLTLSPSAATSSPTPTATATSSPTPTATATSSPTPTATATNSPTPTATATPSPTPTKTATPAPTPVSTIVVPCPTQTPAPTFRVQDGVCDAYGPTPFQCFNAGGDRYICCASPCPTGDPPANPTCAANPTSTSSPCFATSTPAPTTTSTPAPGTTTSAPTSTTSAPTSTTSAPTSTTSAPTTTTSAPTTAPGSTNTPAPTAQRVQPVGGTCDAYGQYPNQCFAANGKTYICCQNPCPLGAPAEVPFCQ